MPPVLGPRSPSKIRLKSWAGCSGYAVVAVADREERDLGAVEVLLDHHPLARRPRGPAPRRGRVVTTTPLPAASPSSLTTYGAPNSSSAAATSAGWCRRGAARSARRRRPSRPWRTPWSPRAARPPATGRRPRSRPRARRRRRRRPAAPRGRRRPGRRRARSARAATAGPSHRVDVVQRGHRGDAGVARRRVHLGDRRVEGERAGQRVLAAAGADHEGLHGRRA